MKPILIDSDILIEVLRGRNLVIDELWKELADSEQLLLVSPVSVAELWHGGRERQTDVLTNFLAGLTCVPIDRETGKLAGQYLSQYSKSHGLKVADAFIAAGAVLHKAILWTRNRKHYPMPDLTFYEPA